MSRESISAVTRQIGYFDYFLILLAVLLASGIEGNIPLLLELYSCRLKVLKIYCVFKNDLHIDEAYIYYKYCLKTLLHVLFVSVFLIIVRCCIMA